MRKRSGGGGVGEDTKVDISGDHFSGIAFKAEIRFYHVEPKILRPSPQAVNNDWSLNDSILRPNL